MLNRRHMISAIFLSLDWYRSRLCVHNNRRALAAAAVGKEQYAARA
jgi:hypothetical protein